MESVVLGPRFVEAFSYASERYAGKLRRNTRVPAIAHAMAVAALVLDLGGDEDLAIAALLHDVVEDGGGAEALSLIRERWGTRWLGLVEECTDEVTPSGSSWKDRKAAAVAEIPERSPAALLIALADKADNTRTLLRGLAEEGEALFARHAAGDRATFLWYYEALVEAFETQRDVLGPRAAPLLGELARVVELLRRRSG